MITLKKLKDLLTRLTERNMEQVFADWEMLVGFQATAEDQKVHLADGPAEVCEALQVPHLVVETLIQGQGECNGPIFFAFPTPLVVEVIADLTMIPEGAKEAKAQGKLGDDDLEAFREMANLLCGSSNQVFEKLQRNVRISQGVEHLKVWSNESNTNTLSTCLPEERLSYVTMRVESGGKEFPMLEVIPFRVALGLAKQFYGAG